jgi:hypothetical protein
MIVIFQVSELIDVFYGLCALVTILSKPNAHLLRHSVDLSHHGYLNAFLEIVVSVLFDANSINPESHCFGAVSKSLQCLQEIRPHLEETELGERAVFAFDVDVLIRLFITPLP